MAEETIYDLLRMMANRTPWKEEAEKIRFTELLNRLEEVNIFGYMATKITTKEREG